MNEYIDRDALLARLDGIWDCSDIVFPNGRDHICKVPEECKGCKWRDVLAAFKEMVKHATAADVEQVRHGRWKLEPTNPYDDPGYKNRMIKRCSCCGWQNACRYNYCPNCGAHMDGEA